MLHAHLFLGIISFQLLFIAIQWSIFKRTEYGWYILYILCISSYFFLKYLNEDGGEIAFGDFIFNKLIPDKSLSFLAFGIYIKFGRKFLGTKKSSPKLNRWFIILETAIILYSIINFIFVWITHDFVQESYAFSFAFGISFILSVVWLIRLYQNNLYSKYLIIGSSMLALGACLALYIGLSSPHLGIGTNDTTVYLQCGVIADFVFLNIGLVMKTRLLQQKEIESRKAVESERLRISAELHDDLGGGLSTISLLSEMMKEKSGDDKISKQLNTISDSSKNLIQKMNEIVWALNVNNDNLQSLVAYLRQYVVKALDDVGIDCTVIIPGNIPGVPILGNERRNIFLIVKECIHNIIKHSKASKVVLEISATGTIRINIHDNGTGFVIHENEVNHFGLRNLKQRAINLNGCVQWLQNNGTEVQISIPMPEALHKSGIS